MVHRAPPEGAGALPALGHQPRLGGFQRLPVDVGHLPEEVLGGDAGAGGDVLGVFPLRRAVGVHGGGLPLPEAGLRDVGGDHPVPADVDRLHRLPVAVLLWVAGGPLLRERPVVLRHQPVRDGLVDPVLHVDHVGDLRHAAAQQGGVVRALGERHLPQRVPRRPQLPGYLPAPPHHVRRLHPAAGQVRLELVQPRPVRGFQVEGGAQAAGPVVHPQLQAGDLAAPVGAGFVGDDGLRRVLHVDVRGASRWAPPACRRCRPSTPRAGPCRSGSPGRWPSTGSTTPGRRRSARPTGSPPAPAAPRWRPRRGPSCWSGSSAGSGGTRPAPGGAATAAGGHRGSRRRTVQVGLPVDDLRVEAPQPPFGGADRGGAERVG
jgi:hypothetical protein